MFGMWERKEERSLGLVVGLGIGALVGGAIALLLAPQAGTDLRRSLGERGRDLSSKVRSRVGRDREGTEVASDGGPS